MIIPLIILMMTFGTFAFSYVAHDAYRVDEKGIMYAMVVGIVVINVIGLEMIIVECL
ncbi:putative membrane protein [Staphylococcus phage vB_SauM_LM12]|nr:putative membrane protein [Staphylococcus phage vB_SauM_LM12]